MYMKTYVSSLGLITMTSDGENLTGLWFENQKYFGGKYDLREAKPCGEQRDIFQKVEKWLDDYFKAIPRSNSEIPVKPVGTDFQQKVWKILMDIPYVETITYGEIGKLIEKDSGKRVSAQAVGNAVGRNPISIIIPCHRVIGSDGSLKGYAGGIDRKKKLLEMEAFSK